MKRNYILAIDPSGNFLEGKGQSGWCLMNKETKEIIKFGIIKANKYDSKETYWAAHVELIDNLIGYGLEVILEDYRLYANRAQSQINSQLETPKLIGILEIEAYWRSIPIALQPAAIVKQRWNNDILIHKEIITKHGKKYKINNVVVNNHILDAVRHAVHYATFGGIR